MPIRRIVTAHDKAGKSVVVSDGPSPWRQEFQYTPGFASTVVWQTPPLPVIPFDGKDPTRSLATLIPAAGGTTFVIVTFPPDAVMADPNFNPELAGQELARASPGLVDHFEIDNPGMHTTPTADYAIVLNGEIWLELDDSKTVHLKQHDVVVQNGTRHAWRNRGAKAATLAFILIGSGKKV